MRCQTTHERANDRCLTQLIKLRADMAKELVKFESQKLKEVLNVLKTGAIQSKMDLSGTKIEAIRRITEFRCASQTWLIR